MSIEESDDGRAHQALGVASTLAGGLAIALTVWGQMAAARRYASDVNSGHPMADAPLMYILAIAPGIGFSALAVGLGLIADRDPGTARRWAVAGIVVGLVAAVLSLTGIPGHLMADHWIEPLPDERR